MRIGDLDALFRAINKIRCPQGASMGDGLAEACQAIMDAPTIDAVPVVRCKDCKHWGIGHTSPVLKGKCPCVVVDRVTRPDDFCSYGERKDGEG